MTFREIANRITGISFPIFGISWSPPKLEIQVAEKIIIYLEDKRVLYNPFELETPEHCNQSVIKIREFLTEQLSDLQKDSELSNTVRAMRSACRRFLDMTARHEYYFKLTNGEIKHQLGLGGQMIFYSGIGELRGTMGFLIAKILVMYGIDCENDLIDIIPLEYTDGL